MDMQIYIHIAGVLSEFRSFKRNTNPRILILTLNILNKVKKKEKKHGVKNYSRISTFPSIYAI